MKRLLFAAVLLFGFIGFSLQPAAASPGNPQARHWQTDYRHRHHHRHKHHNWNQQQRVPNARSLRKESW